MSFRRAIEEGVRLGFEKAWTDICEGRGDPEERCPMRTSDGCACYYRSYMAAPFWRRWWMDRPTRPPQESVLEAMVSQRVDEVAPLLLSQKRSAS